MNFLRRGFTLLELLIVIAIIGILVTVGAASYSSAQAKARDSRRQQDMKAIQSAMEQYYAVSDNVYPASCTPDTTYLPNGLPLDPQGGTSYTYTTCDTDAYCVCALVENASAGNSTNDACSYVAGTKTHFCVSNLQ